LSCFSPRCGLYSIIFWTPIDLLPRLEQYLEKIFKGFLTINFFVVVSCVCGYLSVFKLLRRLLELFVVRRNPFSLSDKLYSSRVITRFLVKASLSLNRSLQDTEDVFSIGLTARTVLNRLYEKNLIDILKAFNTYNANLYGGLVRTLTR